MAGPAHDGAKEIQLVNRIQSLLEDAGATAMKTHGSIMRKGEPDLRCTWPFGSFAITIVIEVKRPGQVPEPIQMNRLEYWERQKAISFWTSDPDEVLPIIRAEIQARVNGQTILNKGRPKLR